MVLCQPFSAFLTRGSGLSLGLPSLGERHFVGATYGGKRDSSMKNRIRLSAALLSIVAIAACFGIYSKDRVEAATRPQEPEKSAAPSQQPAISTSPQPDSAEPESVYGPSSLSSPGIYFCKPLRLPTVP
jgi:hypothetical protein